jgi:hypothetical protein
MNGCPEWVWNVFAWIGFAQTFCVVVLVIAFCVWNGVEHDDSD